MKSLVGFRRVCSSFERSLTSCLRGFGRSIWARRNVYKPFVFARQGYGAPPPVWVCVSGHHSVGAWSDNC
eukprot:scaffold1120_cov127-Cylindrotheca_fusiformis.AAC.21